MFFTESSQLHKINLPIRENSFIGDFFTEVKLKVNKSLINILTIKQHKISSGILGVYDQKAFVILKEIISLSLISLFCRISVGTVLTEFFERHSP